MNVGDVISLKPEHVLEIGSFSVTNSLLLTLIVVVLFLLFSFSFRKKISLFPSKLQVFLELVVEATLDLMESVLGTRALAEKYLPYVASIFLFVMSCNWFGLLPGFSAFGIKEHGLIVPLFRSPAADLNFTLALAVSSVIISHVLAIKALGIKLHLHKFFNFKNPIQFFVGILELVSEFAKVISFSFRLFGNIFAGEVLLIVIAALTPYLMPIPFTLLELFVGFIQAFIFAMLTLVFIATAVTPHGEHKHAKVEKDY